MSMTTGPVLLVGAGGLGCGAALGLGTAGVREVIVVDNDRVDESNLHRQVLHDRSSVGVPKVASMARSLRARFPGMQVPM